MLCTCACTSAGLCLSARGGSALDLCDIARADGEVWCVVNVVVSCTVQCILLLWNRGAVCIGGREEKYNYYNCVT